MKTRITELLGIEMPIIAGAIGILSSPKWIADFCNLGGLGILAAVHLSPEGLRQCIRKIRDLTDKPFGVNLLPINIRHDEMLQVMVEEKVPVFSYGRGNPTKSIHAAIKAGSIAMPTIGSLHHAEIAVKAGAQALMVTGTEAGGHTSFIGTMVLVPLICRNVKIPVVAGGGITVPEQFAAALCLGADAIEMGTRLLVTKEAPIHENVKQAFVKASADDTYSTVHISGRHLRGLLNKYRKQFIGMPDLFQLPEGEDVGFDSPRAKKWISHARRGYIEGDIENGCIECGQGIGLINDIPTVAELIDRMMRGVVPAIERARAIV